MYIELSKVTAIIDELVAWGFLEEHLNVEIRGAAEALDRGHRPRRAPTSSRRAAQHRCQLKTVRRNTRSTARVNAASKASW